MLDSLGEAHGYAIMAELKDRVGGGWKPSPGAIYPALLALVGTGHVQAKDHDGIRIYSLTKEGRRVAATALELEVGIADRSGRGRRGPRLRRLAPRHVC